MEGVSPGSEADARVEGISRGSVHKSSTDSLWASSRVGHGQPPETARCCEENGGKPSIIRNTTHRFKQERVHGRNKRDARSSDESLVSDKRSPIRAKPQGLRRAGWHHRPPRGVMVWPTLYRKKNRNKYTLLERNTEQQTYCLGGRSSEYLIRFIARSDYPIG